MLVGRMWNMTKQVDENTMQVLRILEEHYNGLDAPVIAKMLDVPLSVVQDIVKDWDNGAYKTR